MTNQEIAKEVVYDLFGVTDVFVPCPIVKAIKQALDDKDNQWISVEDELPNKGNEIRSENVLILRDCGEGTLTSVSVSFAWKKQGNWYDQRGYRITHWQPLPEPPTNKQ